MSRQTRYVLSETATGMPILEETDLLTFDRKLREMCDGDQLAMGPFMKRYTVQEIVTVSDFDAFQWWAWLKHTHAADLS